MKSADMRQAGHHLGSEEVEAAEGRLLERRDEAERAVGRCPQQRRTLLLLLRRCPFARRTATSSSPGACGGRRQHEAMQAREVGAEMKRCARDEDGAAPTLGDLARVVERAQRGAFYGE